VTKKSIHYQPYELTCETWKKKILEKIETSLYVTKEIERERIKGEKRKSKRKEEKVENWERAEKQREKNLF